MIIENGIVHIKKYCIHQWMCLLLQQELIDHKMLQCRRIVNREFMFVSWCECPPPPSPPLPLPSLPSLPSPLLLSFVPCIAILGTVDFVLPDGKCFFRTCDEERDKVIFQMVRQDLPPPSLLIMLQFLSTLFQGSSLTFQLHCVQPKSQVGAWGQG